MAVSRPWSILNRKGPSLWTGAALLLVCLALYLVTLDNGLQPWQLTGGDLITHQYAQAQLRFANAPGYPLYTVLGWAWFQFGKVALSSWFNPTEILSLFSTIWGLGSLAVLYLLLLELTKRNWVVAGLTTLLYGTTFFFWYYSVTSEEYSAAVLHTALMVLFAFRWERTRDDKYILLLALLVGLALANLITVLLALPAVVFIVVKSEPAIVRRGRLMGKAVLLVLVPLLSYAYVYIRGAQHPEWRGEGVWTSTMAWFVDFMSTGQGRGELTWSLGGWGPEPLSHIPNELTVLGLVAGLVGIAFLGWRRGGLLCGIILGYAPFIYLDRFGNWFQVIMPLYLILAVGLGILADRAWRRFPGWPRGLVVAGLVLLLINRVWVNFPDADQRDKPGDTALELGQTIVADEPPAGAIINGRYEENLSLQYLTTIWGERQELRVVITDDFLELWASGAENLYLTKEAAGFVLPKLSPRPHLSSQGLQLIALKHEAGRDTAPMADRLDADVGDNLRLLGYYRGPTEAGLHLALYWQATGSMDTDYAVSVRPTQGGELLFHDGQLLQQDHAHPVWGHYPTSAWKRDEVVRDDYVVDLPPEVGYDGVSVVVYSVTDGGFQELGTVSFALSTNEESTQGPVSCPASVIRDSDRG